MTKEMCVEKSIQMFVKLERENPHLFDWIEKQCKMENNSNKFLERENPHLIGLKRNDTK